MTDSPWEESPSGISATIKAPGAANDGPPWIVFHGSSRSIRQQVIDFMGYDASQLEGLSDVEVFLNGLTDFRSAYTAQSGTGGRWIKTKPKAGTESASVAEGGDAWDQAAQGESAPAEPERNPLLDAIEASGDVDSLKRLWAENKPEFEADESLMATWKAKGKALSGK